jgi:GSH-dependent disulfide-bond oxidoreductase
MIDVYGPNTPNVIKVTACLEELGIAYSRLPLDIMKGEQLTPRFLAISPNNRIPVIVDYAPADEAGPLPVFESGAILVYLAEKAGRLLPEAARARSEVIAWVMWQMSGQGPMLGQCGHFRNYAPERIPYAVDRFGREAQRLYRVLDTRLKTRDFIVDGNYTIADIACWPWTLFHEHHGVNPSDFPEVERWHRAIAARPAVRRALGDFEVPPPKTRWTAEERKILFEQGR